MCVRFSVIYWNFSLSLDHGISVPPRTNLTPAKMYADILQNSRSALSYFCREKLGVLEGASLVPSPIHACTREKGSGQKGHTSLSSRYVYCSPIRLQNHDHMTFNLVECNYAWSVCTRVRLVYAHGTEVAVGFYCTHTWIAYYCIPAGRVSATLLTS